MEFFIQNISSVLFFPLWISVLIFIGKFTNILKSKRLVLAMTLLSSIWGLLVSCISFFKVLVSPNYIYETTINFISINDLNLELGLYVDLVSSMMLLVLFAVSLLVQIYSYGYMYKDKSFVRFFALMNFFVFSMCGLVISPTLFQTYIFWELVGVTSYLLIAFWFKKITASKAGKKAFIMNRIGDFCLLAGLIISSVILYNYAGQPDFADIPFDSVDTIAAYIYTYTSEPLFIIICILLLFGSIAKSAQFPLHTWLADAMEGPTPVSALLHSATMVAAGVFLIARLYPLYYQSAFIMNFIFAVGIITALICAFFAITCNDIKRILAYSTNSQLGIMFAALGCGALTGSMVYLASHAFIKAMLFLCAGIIMIMGLGKTDISYFSKLRQKLPLLAVIFLVGALSLSGILFCGFSAKAIIFHHLFETSNYIAIISLVTVSFMTAFYIFRLYFLVFEGKDNGNEMQKPPLVTVITVSIFAVIVVLLGFFFPNMTDLKSDLLPLSCEILAVISAFLCYLKVKNLPKIPLIYKLSYNRFYIDSFYDYISKQVYNCVCKIADFIDNYVFDGAVFAVVFITKLCSWLKSKMQTGSVQSYLAYSFFIISIILTGFCVIYSLVAYFTEV